jgi:hypothetical protein
MPITARRLLNMPKFSTPKNLAASIIATTFKINAAPCPNESEKTFLVTFSMSGPHLFY